MKNLYIQPETKAHALQCQFSLCDGIFSVRGNAPFDVGGGAEPGSGHTPG